MCLFGVAGELLGPAGGLFGPLGGSSENLTYFYNRCAPVLGKFVPGNHISEYVQKRMCQLLCKFGRGIQTKKQNK